MMRLENMRFLIELWPENVVQQCLVLLSSREISIVRQIASHSMPSITAISFQARFDGLIYL